MELAISIALVAEILFFVIMSFFMAVFVLWPVNDRPSPHPFQWLVLLFLEVVLFVTVFGFLTFKIVA
jgi:hypothetical protein